MLIPSPTGSSPVGIYVSAGYLMSIRSMSNYLQTQKEWRHCSEQKPAAGGSGGADHEIPHIASPRPAAGRPETGRFEEDRKRTAMTALMTTAGGENRYTLGIYQSIPSASTSQCPELARTPDVPMAGLTPVEMNYTVPNPGFEMRGCGWLLLYCLYIKQRVRRFMPSVVMLAHSTVEADGPLQPA